MPSLSGKTALVTGSTSGIGLAIARALAAEGATIILNGFGDHEGPTAEVARAGVRTGFHGADLGRVADIEAMMAYAQDEFGGVDILVNNAGIQHVAPIDEFPVDRWDAVIAVNLTSAFHTTRLALPGMKARGWGRIVNIASAHGLVASVQKSAYVAAKHGIVGLTKVTALETATTGITANAICPGWVLTPLVQKQIDARAANDGIPAEQARKDLLAEKEPSLAFTTTDQIGAMAVFLCGEHAANMRGIAWSNDGGWTAQ